MTDTITIALNKLLAWDGNVRKTERDKALDETGVIDGRTWPSAIARRAEGQTRQMPSTPDDVDLWR